MNKKLFDFFLVAFFCISLSGCCNNDSLIAEKEKLTSEISQLKVEKENKLSEIVKIKEENGTAKYIITFKIKQTHITLDIGEHIKDSLNEITFDVPVDKEYYNALSVGDTIEDDFRMGSLIVHGSFGSWKVTVESKTIK